MRNTKESKTRLQAEDMSFLDDLQNAIIMQKTPKSMLVLWLLVIVVVTSLVWAHFAVVEEVTKGEAKVIPASHEQTIESFEDGTLQELYVKEGQLVEKGQPLLRLDSTRSEANYQEELSKSYGLQGSIARARAEAYDLPLDFPDEIKDFHTIVQDETKAYQTRRKLLDDSISSLSHNLELAEKEVSLSEPLAKRGLISDMEILRLRRQANDLRVQIADRTNKYRSDANSELTRLESEFAQVEARLVGRKDVINHALITAPVKGTINSIKTTTIDSVISRGEQIMSLIPSEDNLLLETRIKPAEVAFLRPGLPATVKISAYDFAIYGGLDGVIESISPDTIIDETKMRSGREDATYYRVYVRTHGTDLQVKEKNFPIIPGMTASVEIKTGEKTILSYLLKPVLKAREAFRER
ncbi:MAG: HlyD family efflux transporter periplasmic adaptor subunit [Pantoea sp.]|uniref:Hemolysin secretion protein D n=1 Tax=Pantoea phytobeneficialis TaxID=2052056 RepID=A0AAP9H4N4_9GAMM|nr:HlyD family efflux transporter periplasmic adaptor subunit [Pantoea phytobeneficialis]MDO6406238.1 HlyD family efflux transporter periplasmic adaptor subunit [Pantoea phytobeneficialis]QGR06264.1 hemolysin secretion protein D [Pantoea phytobeneficialis]